MTPPLIASSPPLLQRDAWAATFEQRLAERKSPRTDCPAKLPAAPKSLGADHARREAALPLNDLQVDIVNAFAALDARSGGRGAVMGKHRPTLQGEALPWITEIVERHLGTLTD